VPRRAPAQQKTGPLYSTIARYYSYRREGGGGGSIIPPDLGQVFQKEFDLDPDSESQNAAFCKNNVNNFYFCLILNNYEMFFLRTSETKKKVNNLKKSFLVMFKRLSF
jgi:hypothetical protein